MITLVFNDRGQVVELCQWIQENVCDILLIDPKAPYILDDTGVVVPVVRTSGDVTTYYLSFGQPFSSLEVVDDACPQCLNVHSCNEECID